MARRLGSTTTTFVLAAAAVLATAPGAAAADRGPQTPPPAPAPLASASPAAPAVGTELDGQWIVVFRPGTTGARGLAQQLVRDNGGMLLHTYEHALKGFSARMSDARAEALRRHPHVLSVEQDEVTAVADTQEGATWGLDRSDQVGLPLDGSYTDGNEGAGAHVYVIDTGVSLSHGEFAGRIGNGFDAITSGGNANDCNGHGTHVAGTAAGATYGIADQAVVHPVRVLGCNGSGSNSAVLAGIDWVRKNHVKPAVANMSLGGGASTAIDTAVGSAIADGVVFAVAAGNENTDACTSSPARASAAITVGSTTSSDARSSFSNYGRCLDVFAPGSGITSAWHTSPSATHTISGTSMATPHVAGAAALYLSANPGATPAQFGKALADTASTGRISGAGAGSPNALLHTSPLWNAPPAADEPTTPAPPAPAPVAGLVNGGFENGAQGWTERPGGIIGSTAVNGQRTRSGSWSAWLGGYNGANDSLWQRVTVPAEGTSLTYWWYLASAESSRGASYDGMSVRVHTAEGAYLGTLRTRTNTAARGAWHSDRLSLNAYAGRDVIVEFAATTNAVAPSSFFVDDVSLG